MNKLTFIFLTIIVSTELVFCQSNERLKMGLGGNVRILNHHVIRGDDTSRTEYCFNQKGNIIKRSEFDLTGELNKLELISYNSDGFISGIRNVLDTTMNKFFDWSYDKESEMHWCIEYDYQNQGLNKYRFDSNGNIIESIICQLDGFIFHMSIFSYNSKQRLTKELYTSLTGAITYEQVYLYDSKFQLLKETYCELEFDDRVKNISNFKKSKTKEIPETKIVTHFNYLDFDLFGNWTKRVKMVGNEIDCVEQRMLEYF